MAMIVANIGNDIPQTKKRADPNASTKDPPIKESPAWTSREGFVPAKVGAAAGSDLSQLTNGCCGQTVRGEESEQEEGKSE
mmetsp:Transcript_26251/g.55407  ORF Transcript_26251/g.55407 Transcript_26251/m.55407 type:complete len:81 (-) Transcript_26251:213-455(-)